MTHPSEWHISEYLIIIIAATRLKPIILQLNLTDFSYVPVTKKYSIPWLNSLEVQRVFSWNNQCPRQLWQQVALTTFNVLQIVYMRNTLMHQRLIKLLNFRRILWNHPAQPDHSLNKSARALHMTVNFFAILWTMVPVIGSPIHNSLYRIAICNLQQYRVS